MAKRFNAKKKKEIYDAIASSDEPRQELAKRLRIGISTVDRIRSKLKRGGEERLPSKDGEELRFVHAQQQALRGDLELTIKGHREFARQLLGEIIEVQGKLHSIAAMLIRGS